jgi:hypothetical protein
LELSCIRKRAILRFHGELLQPSSPTLCSLSIRSRIGKQPSIFLCAEATFWFGGDNSSVLLDLRATPRLYLTTESLG